MIRKILALIPFFGGESSAAHSPRDSRLAYLRETVISIEAFAERIVVGVCTAQDANDVGDIASTVRLECNPIHLPAYFLARMQQASVEPFIFYSEADQRVYISRRSEIFGLLDRSTCYISPHRFYQLAAVPEEVLSYHTPGAPALDLVNNQRTPMFRSHQEIDPTGLPQVGCCYTPPTKELAFGGAWMCAREVFKQLVFQRAARLPIEHSSGFDLFNHPGMVALKTVNPFDLFVIHLSGRDMHRRAIAKYISVL